MGLFNGGETKEEKQARKQQEMLAKYGLQNLTDPTDISSVKKIVEELVGTLIQLHRCNWQQFVTDFTN